MKLRVSAFVLSVLCLFFATACHTDSPRHLGSHKPTKVGAPPTSAEPDALRAERRMGLIKVSADRSGFEAATGHARFSPWGFNYDRDYKMRLLEEYWDSEWETVTADFREMKQLGANVVRIHLQFAKFMESPTAPNRHALAQLRKLLKLAEKTGLYLDLTGLACYRKRDVPAWYNQGDESARWKAQAVFWEAVSGACARSPAVFCYNLMNEPVVPSGKRNPGDWLTGELEGFTYVQFISLDQAGRPRPEIAREWIETLVKAIRKHDRRHMITAGLLPNSLDTPVSFSGFPPDKVTGALDYVSVHLYPNGKRLDEDLATLRGFNVGKPVIVEETFPLACSSQQLREFIQRAKPSAAGWMSFYWGRTPAELRAAGGTGEALTSEWLLVFQETGR